MISVNFLNSKPPLSIHTVNSINAPSFLEIQDPREAKLEHKRVHKIVQKRNGFRRALMLIFSFKNYQAGFTLIQRVSKKMLEVLRKSRAKGPTLTNYSVDATITTLESVTAAFYSSPSS